MIAACQIATKHLAIIILIFIIGAYLTLKALPENSWDGWRVGSAQTLLSNKHWVENGFKKNYFLFLPQGYSKVIRYFDDLQLRQHARGIATGGFIGKRLYYTHYPSGYLVPTALLMKLGAERFWLRLLEISFSLSGLIFLYWFLNLVSNRFIAFVGVFFYSISTIFLDYADSLVNQPIDDLWRLVIITLSVFSLSASEKSKTYLNYGTWLLFFLASVSSYDSTFFLFAWLVGLDLIILRKINLKKWTFWASAPILAFAVQLFQNTLYLGWHNMLLDLYGTFKVQMVGSRSGFFASHFKRLIEPFGWFFGVKWYLGILLSALGIATLKFGKKYLPDNVDIRFLYLGFAAILFHFLFFPSLFFYQGRIIAIFGGLLVGILTVSLFKIINRDTNIQMHDNDINKIRIISINSYISIGLIIILVLGLWFIQGKRTYDYVKQWPNNVWSAEKIDFDKKIKNLVSGDKVIFQMLGTSREVVGSDRYPAPASEDEYYIDAPILGFTNTNDLIRDFNYLKKRSGFPFNTIVIADQKPIIEEIKTKLKLKEPFSKIENKFILIIRQ